MTTPRWLIFDIETAGGTERLWDTDPEAFFRLGGYAWNKGPVKITDNLDEMRSVIREADKVVGHNIHRFDLTAIFGKDSTEPLEMARENRVFDTWTHAKLCMPAPWSFTGRDGKTYLSNDPQKAKRWFSLDNLCYQLGLEGKVHDLKALAKKHGGFDKIPTDDPEFREYLIGDVEASRELAKALLGKLPLRGYPTREQLNDAIDAQNTRNGWRVDRSAAQARVDELDAERDRYMSYLVERYDMPTEGKMPLRSKAGKEAVFRALESVGISADDLPRTEKGAPSLSGDGLIEAAQGKGEEAETLARNIAALGGMRPLAEAALKHVHADGKVHPDVDALQISGRKSTKDPGLTVWTSRGDGAVEKSYFVPNADDELLIEFDYSQADARIVAAYSGDTEFAKRFAPGSDMHMITAELIWGKEIVATDPKRYRQAAKPVTHASGYGAQPRKLAEVTGRPLEEMQAYNRNYADAYPLVMAWRERVIDEAKRYGYVTNAWGRRMRVEAGREFTQAPALYGQSGTRELVVDALIRLPDDVLRMLVAQVHDALVFSVPKDRVEEVSAVIRAAMEVTWQPPDGSGQPVHFPVGVGEPASNWMDASHG